MQFNKFLQEKYSILHVIKPAGNKNFAKYRPSKREVETWFKSIVNVLNSLFELNGFSII